ncbi:hypothetical protein MPER_06457 [Moniliophthora perniciosa FA553]|nr:hypothetical protein MPER_06457 [Moniliophthora perniciosa FA553]
MSPTVFLFFCLLQFAAAWDTFVVPHTPDKDDAPALVAALAKHASDATILFEKGITYNIWTPVKFPELRNVDIVIEGNITLLDDVAAVQATVASSEFPGHWYSVIFFKLGSIT